MSLEDKIYIGVPVYDESVITLEKLVNSLKNLRGLDFKCIFLVNRSINAIDQVQTNNQLALDYLRNLSFPYIVTEELVCQDCNIGIARNTVLEIVRSTSNLDKVLSSKYFISVDADTQFSENYATNFRKMRKDHPNAQLIRPGLTYNGFEDISRIEISTTCINLINLILTLKDQTQSYQKGVITSSGSHAIFNLNALKDFSYKPMGGGEDTDFSKRVCQSLPTESCIKYPSLELFTSFRLSNKTNNGFGHFPKNNEKESEILQLEQFRIKMKLLIQELYKYSDKYTAYAFTDSNEFRCLIDAGNYLEIATDFDFQKIKDDLKKSIDQNIDIL